MYARVLVHACIHVHIPCHCICTRIPFGLHPSVCCEGGGAPAPRRAFRWLHFCTQGYIDKIGKLATHCGGGSGVPLVRFMDRFGKMYGANKKLGEDFITAVVDLHLSDLEPCTWIRVAALLSNLASDKVSDGVAKLLLPSDIDKLKGKACKAKAVSLDGDLGKAYRIATDLRTSGKIDLEQQDELIGQFFTRSLLHLVQKGKVGPERVARKDQQEIIGMFVSEATAMTGDYTTIVDPDGKWKALTVIEGAPDAESSNATIVMTDADLRNPERILANKGFTKDGVVFERAVGPAAGLYKIANFSSSEVTMGQLTAFEEPTFDVKVPLAQFIKDWGSYNGKVPYAVPTSTSKCATAHASMKMDEARCTVFKALKDFESNARAAPGATLQYGLQPNVVVAAGKIEKGKLVLAPFSDLNKVRPDDSQGAAQIKCGGHVLYVSPPARATDQKKMDGKDVFYVPYWWVRETDKEDQANVALVQQTTVHITFKAYKNTRVIQQFEKLLVYKAKTQHAPLQDARKIKREENPDGQKDGKAEPKKRAKK